MSTENRSIAFLIGSALRDAVGELTFKYNAEEKC